MDEQKTHADGELDLGLDTASDDGDDTAANGTEDQGTESEDQEQDALNLEPKPKDKSKAEIVRNQQIEKWSLEIASGKKTLADMPANLNWLKPLVEAKLGTTAQEEKDLDSKLEEALDKREADRKFKSLNKELQETLNRDQKAKLIEKYEKFRKKLDPLDALETAMEALGIDPAEERLDVRRQAARLRTPGNYKISGKDTSIDEVHTQGGFSEVMKNFTPEQRLAYLKKLKGIK